MPSFEDLDDEVTDEDVASLGLDPTPTPAEIDFEEQMSEVEMRLEKAYYYRMLLQQNPFDSDSPIAIEVWKDISKILRARLGELLGIGKGPSAVPLAAQFTDEEAVILKSVAGKLLKNANVIAQPKPKKAPGLRKVSVAEVEGKKPTMVMRQEAVMQQVVKPAQPAATITARGGKAGAKNKTYKKHITDDGREVVMDVTKQVRPVGMQPMPMPNIELSNAHATAQAAQIASQQDEGLIELVKAKE